MNKDRRSGMDPGKGIAAIFLAAAAVVFSFPSVSSSADRKSVV